LREWLAALLVVVVFLAGFSTIFSVEPPGIFVFADRMVYGRPAQVTVFGIVLDSEGRPVSGVSLSVDIVSPEDELVFSEDVVTGSDGKFSTVYRLSGSAPEGSYEVQVSDAENVYQPVVFSFEVCGVCALPPPTVTVSTTLLRTVTATSTFTRNVTRLETVYQTLSEGQVVTVTETSVVNGSVVTFYVTRTVGQVVSDAGLLFYLGLGMVAVVTGLSVYAARRFRPAGRLSV